MWVLTEEDNDAARATYQAAGGTPHDRPQLMLEWNFEAGTVEAS